MAAPRTLAAVWAAKTAAVASRALGRGGGTAVGGLLGLELQPALVRDLARQLGQGCVVVTGTNGKTTTSRLIAETARAAGLLPLANASGSNLMRGIAAALAQATGPDGAIVDADRRIGVFEVDEATLPQALTELRPRAAVFLNLFRDQLDRYGEVDAVAARWRAALAAAPHELWLILNADDPAVASLGEGRDNVTYFGVGDKKLDRGRLEHAADSITCVCGARLAYDAVFLSHVGAWRCQACGRKRPDPHVIATDIDLRDGRSLSFRLRAPGRRAGQPRGKSKERTELGLGGLYNVYNALAVRAAASVLALPHAAAAASLSAAGAAFGRQEGFEIDGRRVELLLAKNPAGLNQVLQTLLLDPSRQTALFLLNDGIADGRDVSWVWDADFEVAAGRFERTVVSGGRAWDMALRLKYAGWDEASTAVEPDISQALAKAISVTPAGACLTVVPTYTAMLTVRELLAKRAGREPFWRQ
jgi:UDP-N-acetylmuramyl tripeptide synthase